MNALFHIDLYHYSKAVTIDTIKLSCRQFPWCSFGNFDHWQKEEVIIYRVILETENQWSDRDLFLFLFHRNAFQVYCSSFKIKSPFKILRHILNSVKFFSFEKKAMLDNTKKFYVFILWLEKRQKSRRILIFEHVKIKTSIMWRKVQFIETYEGELCQDWIYKMQK